MKIYFDLIFYWDHLIIMEVELMNVGDVKVLSVNGRIDATTSQQLQDIVLNTAHHTQKFLLDLSNVNYMSSSGYG